MKTPSQKARNGAKHSDDQMNASQKNQKGTFVFTDNRPETIHQQGLKDIIQNRKDDQFSVLQKNKTGIPDNLKNGIEQLSGIAMDDVKVHYNSSKPAQLNAHAYAQGNQIHLGPNQEKHLPHEAWHVVQQKKGRVKPTLSLENSMLVNNEKQLESEADIMGARAMQLKIAIPPIITNRNNSLAAVIQRMQQDEIPQLARVADHILEMYPNYTIVGMGGSPAPIIAYLQSQGRPAFNIPLSIKGQNAVLNQAQQLELRRMLEASINGLEGRQNIVVIDVSVSGVSIARGIRVIRAAYPNKNILGLAIKENDDHPNNAAFLEEVKAQNMQTLSPNDINGDVQEFMSKLLGSGYKQYRAVGVFKPQDNDTWQDYLQDEHDINGEDGFDHGSRARYDLLVKYLSDVQNYTEEGIGNMAYETNLDSFDQTHPKTRHKQDEDAQANQRIQRLQAQIQQLAVQQQQDDNACCQCCFLTTACTLYKGLPDDCMELSTLRMFRDHYILQLNNGKELVDLYYKNSPIIIQRINNTENPGIIYDQIYSVITYCVRRIWEEEYEKALVVYLELVVGLKNDFASDLIISSKTQF